VAADLRREEKARAALGEALSSSSSSSSSLALATSPVFPGSGGGGGGGDGDDDQWLGRTAASRPDSALVSALTPAEAALVPRAWLSGGAPLTTEPASSGMLRRVGMYGKGPGKGPAER